MKTIGIILFIIIVCFIISIPLCVTLLIDSIGFATIYIIFAQFVQIIISFYCGYKFIMWFLSQIKDND